MNLSCLNERVGLRAINHSLFDVDAHSRSLIPISVLAKALITVGSITVLVSSEDNLDGMQGIYQFPQQLIRL